MKTKRDYHAMLTVYSHPSLPQPERRRIAVWLRMQAKEIERKTSRLTGGRYTARLMK